MNMKGKTYYILLSVLVVFFFLGCNSLNNEISVDSGSFEDMKKNTQKKYRLIKTISGQVNEEEYWEHGQSYDENNELCYEYLQQKGEYQYEKYYVNGLIVKDTSEFAAYDNEGVELYSSKNRVIEYYKDLNGNINLKIERDILENIITKMTKYLYDEENRKTEMQWLSRDGKHIRGRMIYKYYDNDELKSEIKLWGNIESYRIEYEYVNNCEIISTYENDELIKYKIFTYDDRNNIIKEERRFSYQSLEEEMKLLYNEDPIAAVVEYVYDDNNNQIFRHLICYDVDNSVMDIDIKNITKFNEANQPIEYFDIGKELNENGVYIEWENIEEIEYSNDFLEGCRYYGKDKQSFTKYIYEEYFQ